MASKTARGRKLRHGQHWGYVSFCRALSIHTDQREQEETDISSIMKNCTLTGKKETILMPPPPPQFVEWALQSVEMDGQGQGLFLCFTSVQQLTQRVQSTSGSICCYQKSCNKVEACVEIAPRLLLKVLPTGGKRNDRTGGRKGHQAASLLCTKYFAFALATTNK